MTLNLFQGNAALACESAAPDPSPLPGTKQNARIECIRRACYNSKRLHNNNDSMPSNTIPSTMRALVYQGPEQLEYRTDIPVPTMGDDDVLMQIKSVGICGTDLHIYRGGMKVPPGTIPGHEFSGVVVKIGKNVHNVKVGERVVAEHVVTCGKCEYCKAGKPNLCGHREIIGVQRPGALGEYVSVPAELVYTIPDAMTYDEAALIEPLSIAVYAARESGYLLNKRIAIIGQGPIGLLLDQVLSAGGALVTGIDIRDSALRFAKKMKWAHHTINSKTNSLKKRMNDIKSPDGFDIVYEVVGIEQTAEMALEITRRDGSVYLLGVFSSPSKINMMEIVKKELNVHGSWTCAFSFPDSIDLVAREKVDLRSLITHTYPIRDGARAFAEANTYSQHRIKTIITF